MARVDVVCLCDRSDLKSMFEAHVEGEAPWLRLVNVDEVADSSAIMYALAWKPAPGTFTHFRNLRLVTSVGAGVDSILACPDLPAATTVSRLMDHEQAAMMAAFAVWHVVGHDRHLDEYRAQQAAAVWKQISKAPPSRFPVGVLGFGLMGRAISVALNTLGYPVRALTRTTPHDVPPGIEVLVGLDKLHELAGAVRTLINVLPLTDTTRGLLAWPVFQAMRNDALLVQIGRGEHLNEPDLLRALNAGEIAGAALDVFEREPLAADHPFWRHPRIRITPHVASEADDAHVVRWLGSEIQRIERGETALGAVNRKQGY